MLQEALKDCQDHFNLNFFLGFITFDFWAKKKGRIFYKGQEQFV